jgi:hypothetical protein
MMFILRFFLHCLNFVTNIYSRISQVFITYPVIDFSIKFINKKSRARRGKGSPEISTIDRGGGGVESPPQIAGGVESPRLIGGGVESPRLIGGGVESPPQIGGGGESPPQAAAESPPHPQIEGGVESPPQIEGGVESPPQAGDPRAFQLVFDIPEGGMSSKFLGSVFTTLQTIPQYNLIEYKLVYITMHDTLQSVAVGPSYFMGASGNAKEFIEFYLNRLNLPSSADSTSIRENSVFLFVRVTPITKDQRLIELKEKWKI